MMVGQLHVNPDLDALAQAVAARWVELAREAVAARNGFFVALSGGSTPRALYSALREARYAREVDWNKVWFYFGDERNVPPDHPDSNYRMARETLFDHIPVPSSNIFRMEGEAADPNEAATRYATALTAKLPLSARGIVQFDLVLLGLGNDGHVASLFPGTPVLHERARLVEAVWVEQLKTWRITLTLPVIEEARHVLLMVSGRGKADILRDVFTAVATPPYPVQLINPRGEFEWYVDAEAAALLPKELIS
ncbi:MAG TPA: 6-phosphogluconolactonase [Gammaproteobacteria bacterium]|nr:6-phosphogluconolactonase [Gammaproteobacteria bacterium]